MDNLLGMEVIPDNKLKENWLRTLQEFVIPMASDINKRLGNFIQSVYDLALARGCNQELRQEYERVLKVLK